MLIESEVDKNRSEPRAIANPLELQSVHNFVINANKTAPRLLINAGATVLLAMLYAPALLPLAGVAVLEHVGRNHTIRSRPEIGTCSALTRGKEKLAYHSRRRPQGPVWLAANEDKRNAIHSADPMAYMRRVGWRQSWPFKCVSYARLGLAMARDQANYARTRFIWGQGGVSFHEGVAAARLAQGQWITPNPRTQDHVRHAREWLASQGKSLG